MVSSTLIVLGFLVVMAAVIALARASTARWERDKRAPVATRPEMDPLPSRPAGSALPWRRVGAVVSALRARAARLTGPTRLPSVVQLLPAAWQARAAHARGVKGSVHRVRSWLLHRSLRGSRSATGPPPASPADGAGGTDTDAPPSSRRVRAASAGRTGGVGRGTRRLLHRTVRLHGRRVPAFLHRHGNAEPPTDDDGSPTAPRKRLPHR